MSKTIKEQMRVLVKEHERGLLPKDDYRRLRGALLERAMQGKMDAPDEPTHTRPQHVNNPNTPVVPPTVTAPRKAAPKPPPPPPPAAPLPKPPSPSSTAPARSKSLLLGAIAAGLLVLIGAYLLLSHDSSETDAEVSSATGVESDNTGAIEPLIENFIQEGNWSPGSIRRFARDWSDLDEEIRERAKTTGTFREFARELRDRLNLSEQSNTLATTTSLRELAESLELRVDSRFVVAESAEPEGKTPNSVREQAAMGEPSGSPDTSGASNDRLQPALTPAKENPQMVRKGGKKQSNQIAVADNPAIDQPSKIVAPRKNEVEVPVGQTRVAKSVTTPDTEKVQHTAVTERDAKNASVDDGPKDNTRATVAVLSPKESKPAQVAGTRSVQCSRSLLKTRRKYCRDQLLDGANGPKLAMIRTGSFQMGSTEKDEEQPVRQVSIDSPFAMGVNEVSFAEFTRYCQATGRACPDNPWGDENLPVVNVSWSEARQYTAWLSAQSGATYRLPTEAEWEYAARAGTDTAYPFGDNISYLQAHFSDTRREDRPHPVDGNLVMSNEFGLKHVVGNVSEWVEDAWADNYSGAAANAAAFTGSPQARRVVRGGSYHDRATDLRSAARSSRAAEEKAPYTGFRVTREIH